MTTTTYLPKAGGLLGTGMRLSTPCPTQRIREYLEPETFARPVPEWACTMGHLIEAWVVESVITPQAGPDATLHPQYALEWWGGISHDDCMIEGGPLSGLHEIKSTGSTNPTIDADWLAQLKRRLALIEAETLGHLWVVGKPEDWSANLVLRGPFEVKLTDAERSHYNAELEAMHQWWTDYAGADDLNLFDNQGLADLCERYGCGRCIRSWVDIEDAELDAALLAHVNGDTEARARILKLTGPGTRYKSVRHGLRLTVTDPQPKESVKWDDALAGGVEGLQGAADAAQKAGYVVTTTPSPQVRVSKIADVEP